MFPKAIDAYLCFDQIFDGYALGDCANRTSIMDYELEIRKKNDAEWV